MFIKMKIHKFFFKLFAICIFIAGLGPTQAYPLAIDSKEIALIMESTLVDFDTSMIAIHHGPDLSTTLKYVSKVEDTGWQGRLFGTYAGKEVDVYYTGNLDFIGGSSSQYDISYTSEWFLDGEIGTGTGTGIYTDPDFDFRIDLINLEVSGSMSVSYGVATLTINGSKSLANNMLTVGGSASAFDMPLVGSLADAGLSLVYNQITGGYESFLEVNVLGGWIYSNTETINRGNIRRPQPGPIPPAPLPRPNLPPVFPFPPGGQDGGFLAGEPGFNNMTVSTVPEPDTLALLALGLVGIIIISFKHRSFKHLPA